MSRIIKFRAWDKVRARMLKDVAPGTLTYFDENGGAPHTDCELMQFTGLFDENGKGIYEGDIVKSLGFNNASKVEWKEIQASDDMTAPGAGFQFPTEPSEMEVIGNMYENPELLP